MKVYTYSEARQRFTEVLNIAREEEVIIKGATEKHLQLPSKKLRNPFDIPGIKTKATTKDILAAIKDSRESRVEYDASADS